MEGTSRKRRQAPQVLRFFAPTRLADDLLAGVYERLLADCDRFATVQIECKEMDTLALIAQGEPVGTGGR
jgi:hypothetical protein